MTGHAFFVFLQIGYQRVPSMGYDCVFKTHLALIYLLQVLSHVDGAMTLTKWPLVPHSVCEGDEYVLRSCYGVDNVILYLSTRPLPTHSHYSLVGWNFTLVSFSYPD